MPKPNKDEQIQQLHEALLQQDHVNQVLCQRDQEARRLIWQLVHQLGGTAMIPQKPTPVLWKLEFKNGPEGTLEMIASEMPDPTKEQLDEVANELRGTEKNLALVLQQTALKEYMPAAIEHMLAKDHVIFVGTVWLDAEAARAMRPPDIAQN